MASNVRPSEVARTLGHEIIGHKGLRAVFGERFDSLLDQVYRDHFEEVAEVAQRYHRDTETLENQRYLTEEFLADCASTEVKPSWWKEFLGFVRQQLRKILPELRFSDTDIEAALSRSARAMRKRNGESRGPGVRFAALRREGAPNHAEQSGLLRDNNVPYADGFPEWAGLKGTRLYADYEFLYGRHPQYFDSPEMARAAVELVLSNPEKVQDINGNLSFTGFDEETGAIYRIEIDPTVKNKYNHIRSVFKITMDQYDKIKLADSPVLQLSPTKDQNQLAGRTLASFLRYDSTENGNVKSGLDGGIRFAAALRREGAPNTADQPGQLRDSHVPYRNGFMEEYGFSGKGLYADYEFLFGRHPEYFEDAEHVRAAVEFVLDDPEPGEHILGNLTFIRKDASTGKIFRIEISPKQVGKRHQIRSVHEITEQQYKKVKDRLSRSNTASPDPVRHEQTLKAGGHPNMKGVGPLKSRTVSDFLRYDSTENENVKFSIIGEQGAGRSPDSERLLRNLSAAREMERRGEYDAGYIKFVTGWERGKDGKWRTENSDDWRFRPEVLNRDFDEILTVGDAIDAPELFSLYPELRDYSLAFLPAEEMGGATGCFDRAGEEIALSEELPPERIRSALIHEIQHWIQEKEGFAKGGNLSDAADRSGAEQGDAERFSVYRRFAGEVEARNAERRAELPLEQRLVQLLKETEDVAEEDKIYLERGVSKKDGLNFSVNENGEAEFYVKGVGKKSIYDIISDKTISSRAVIQTDSGSGDWGVVSKAMIRQASPELGLQALPIRLYKGNAGYGLVHIAKHLKDYTFADVSREIENLFGKPNKIYARRDGKAVKLEVFPKPPALWGILELREEQECYSIVSFYPRQNRNSKAKGKLIWEYGSQSVSPQAANELSKNGAVIKPPQTAQEETTAKSDSTIPLLNENVKSEKGERTENIRFSLNQYSDADWRDMVGYMKAKVGTLLTKPDADYRRILEEAGMECFSDADAHVIAAEAMEANQKDHRERRREAMIDWLMKNNLWFQRLAEATGTPDFMIRPSFKFQGEEFTGSYISRAWVEYSDKPNAKNRESKLKKAPGYHSYELAQMIADKYGGDATEIENEMIDYFRHKKRRASKTDRENGEKGFYDEYDEFRKEERLFNKELDRQAEAQWLAEESLRVEQTIAEIIENRQAVDEALAETDRNVFSALYQRVMKDAAPGNPTPEQLDALNAALYDSGDPGAFVRGWKAGRDQAIAEKRREHIEFVGKVLHEKADALKLQRDAAAFAEKHVPKEQQGEFIRGIVGLADFSTLPSRSYPDGKRKAKLEELFEKMIRRGEEVRKAKLIEQTERLFRQAGLRADAERKQRNVLSFEVQKAVNRIREYADMTAEEAASRAAKLQTEIENTEAEGNMSADQEYETRLLDLFGDYRNKSAPEIELAYRELKALVLVGRSEMKEKIRERANEMLMKREEIRSGLLNGKKELSPQERRALEAKRKRSKVSRSLLDTLWKSNNLDSLLSYLPLPSGRESGIVKRLQESLYTAYADKMTRNRHHTDELEAKLNELAGLDRSANGLSARKTRADLIRKWRERPEHTGIMRHQPDDKTEFAEWVRVPEAEAGTKLEEFRRSGRDFEAAALEHLLNTENLRIRKPGSSLFGDSVTDALVDEMRKKRDEDTEKAYYVPVLKLGFNPVEENLTQLEALYMKLMWDQKNIRYKMRFNGWTESSIKQIDAYLRPEVKVLGGWMTGQLEKDRADISQVYERLYFSMFPHEENYFPSVFNRLRETMDGKITLDLSEEGAGGKPMACTPGSVKLRAFHLMEPRVCDALTIFVNHRQQMDHFVTHGETARELRSLFLNKEVAQTIRDVYGNEFYDQFKKEISDFIAGGNVQNQNTQFAQFALNNWARVKMLWNMVSAGKQMFGGLSYFQYSGVPSSAMVSGIADFWKHPVENAKRRSRSSTRFAVRHIENTPPVWTAWQRQVQMLLQMRSAGLRSVQTYSSRRERGPSGFSELPLLLFSVLRRFVRFSISILRAFSSIAAMTFGEEFFGTSHPVQTPE